LTNFNPGESESKAPENSENSPLSLDEFVKTRDKLGTSSLGRTSTLQKAEVTVLDPGIQETQVGVEVQRERARTRLSGGLLGLLTASLVGTGAYIFLDLLVPRQVSQERSNMHRELITIIWTSQVTLVGSALGFYFGSERDSNNSKK
jgi:hypothetical protein